MPRIPLYAKGTGPTVELATGKLSPQISAAALQAPSRAMVELGQQVGRAGAAFAEGEQRIKEGQMKAEQTRLLNEIEFTRRQKKVEFDFQMAERDAEDRRIIAEETDAAIAATSEFLQNDRSTDTRTFNQNFDTFRNELVGGLRGKYDDRRLRLVETAVISSTRGQRSSGASQAFSRGNLARTNAAEAAIETYVNQISLYAEGNPERLRIEGLIQSEFENANTNGLRLKYTPQGVASTIRYQDFNRAIEAAQSETAIDQVLLSVRLDKTLTQGSREKLFADASRVRNVLRGEIRETTSQVINQAVLSAGDERAIEEAIDNREVFEFEMPDGSTSSVDFGLTSATDAGSYKALVASNLKNVEDLSSANILFELDGTFDPEKTGAENAQAVNALYSDDSKALHGKTEGQLDDIALGYANQHQDFVTNTIKTEGVTVDNYGLLTARLDAAEAILDAQLGGRPPLRLRDGPDGTTAQQISSAIATARGNLAEAATEAATQSSLVAIINEGNAEYVQDDVKPDDLKSAVNTVMAENADNVQKQVDILSENFLKYDKFETILNAQAARMTDPNFDPDGEEMADVMAGVELFKLMDLAGEGVLERHVSPENRKRYRAFQILEPHLDASGAIKTIQRKREDIDVDASYKTIEAQVESIRDEKSASYSWYEYIFPFGRDEEFTVQDTSAIVSYIKRLSREYIGLGVEPEIAVELAAKDYGKSHKRVRNIMVPITADLPLEIEEMANAAVADSMLKYPELADTYDSDELSIANLAGTTDRWTLVFAGGHPVTTVTEDEAGNKVARVVEFSKEDLEGYMITQRSDRMLIKEAKRAEINFRTKVENEFITRTGRFEGLRDYEARLLRLRLLHPERSFRLEAKDVRAFAESMEEIIEATPGAAGP